MCACATCCIRQAVQPASPAASAGLVPGDSFILGKADVHFNSMSNCGSWLIPIDEVLKLRYSHPCATMSSRCCTFRAVELHHATAAEECIAYLEQSIGSPITLFVFQRSSDEVALRTIVPSTAWVASARTSAGRPDAYSPQVLGCELVTSSLPPVAKRAIVDTGECWERCRRSYV